MKRFIRLMHTRARYALPLALVLVLGASAFIAVALLQEHADSSRQAELKLGQLQLALGNVNAYCWEANPDVGGNTFYAHHQIEAAKATIAQLLASLRREQPLPVLDHAPAVLRANYAVIDQIYKIGSVHGYGHWINALGGPQGQTAGAAFALVGAASDQYAQRAETAKTLSILGSGLAILLLLIAFTLVHRRAGRAKTIAERLATENAELAALNREEAVTDALTGLRNRRALIEDIAMVGSEATLERPALLALFDLDGFKQYNDTFGHGAGDALLVRLARALSAACDGRATPYRMGGDEFCLLAEAVDGDGDAILAAGTAALSESGDRWKIGCSAGFAWLPKDVQIGSEVLGLADARMYARKARRASAGRQTADALLCLLNERAPDMEAHTSHVAALAEAVAEEMGLDDHEVREIACAAELHDVGKAAIPDAILAKAGPLDADEWNLMRRHTLLGERIMLQAPALANAARLVRASHERIDGTGYPDGLRGDEIPLGARIIFVCEAFDAMVTDRPYSKAMSTEQALAELWCCAGKQFDAAVIEIFCARVERSMRGLAAAGSAATG
jgi:diguanylate cyclase (GGDEF)-like protein